MVNSENGKYVNTINSYLMIWVLKIKTNSRYEVASQLTFYLRPIRSINSASSYIRQFELLTTSQLLPSAYKQQFPNSICWQKNYVNRKMLSFYKYSELIIALFYLPKLQIILCFYILVVSFPDNRNMFQKQLNHRVGIFYASSFSNAKAPECI